jgi:hypothetical protein
MLAAHVSLRASGRASPFTRAARFLFFASGAIEPFQWLSKGAIMKQLLTIGQVGDRLGVQAWKIRKLITDGILPEPLRIATYRVFEEKDLPAIEKALRAAGYLK